DDGGETFTSPRTTTHGDDRFVWVNPRDSRHVVKLDDGGIGISYDRGLKFLYVASLPLSQYYRVAVDNAHPYNVYGGLQDNGCWVGPSAVWTAAGILNEHWSRLCGGDGFYGVPDPKDPRVAYSSSQFLGLQRNDTRNWQVQDIRPGDPTGAIGDRRNWNTWGKPVAEQVLGNAMHPANWDAPLLISPHDAATIYAGGKHLFRSRDRGLTWQDLGDMTSGVDRATLPLMGRMPDETVLSIDDGVPYYPGATAIAESPRRRGVLYVGTDDGKFRISMDDGKTFESAETRFPGLPPTSWFAGIEPSRHVDGTVYVVVDNHRSNDFTNYVFRSTDFGKTFASIVADLPAERVARTIREDHRNPGVLYLGTEIGLFVTVDGGQHWIELKNNMPTLPFNDLAIQARENDLVLASHGRGIWILDQLSALQGLGTAATMDAQLFPIEPAEQIRYTNLKAHAGDLVFRGENPPNGAIVDYWLSSPQAPVTLSVHDAAGTLVQTLAASRTRGVNRVVWNLRHANLPVRGGFGEDDDAPRGGQANCVDTRQHVWPCQVAAAGRAFEQKVEVRDDPRIDAPAADRKLWADFQMQVAGAIRQFAPVADKVQKAPAGDAQTTDLKRQSRELLSRLSGLFTATGRWVGRPTAEQQSEFKFYQEMSAKITSTAGGL
ncbi:MAG TPA: hypothetical protein VM820_20045, partial [Vicinamibacterales bacterium]|nr:hypothetical protein [Vicinamibacterales bacterium]